MEKQPPKCPVCGCYISQRKLYIYNSEQRAEQEHTNNLIRKNARLNANIEALRNESADLRASLNRLKSRTLIQRILNRD